MLIPCVEEIFRDTTELGLAGRRVIVVSKVLELIANIGYSTPSVGNPFSMYSSIFSELNFRSFGRDVG